MIFPQSDKTRSKKREALSTMVMVKMMEGFNLLFHEKLVVDTREPLATLAIPRGLIFDEGARLAVYPPSLLFWTQLLVMLAMQVVIQCIFAVIIYKLIVCNRKSITSTSLIGFGLVIPLAIYIPYYMIETLDLHSKPLKFCWNMMPTLVIFRCIEAIYGTTECPAVERSLSNYILYYSSLMQFEWDPNTNRPRGLTWTEQRQAVQRLLLHFHATSLLCSFAIHNNYEVLASLVPLTSFIPTGSNLLALLSPAHLANSYILAVLTYLVLTCGFDMTALAYQLLGFRTKPVFLNPITQSRSPTEFWNARWNLTVHRMLKCAVYRPLRKHFHINISTAILLTFAASSALHEYAFSLIFYQHRNSNAASLHEISLPYIPSMFKMTAFFMWNGGVLLLDRYLGPRLEPYSQKLPIMLVSTLVVMTALPVSHWYCGDWAVGGFYRDFGQGVWQIRLLEA